MGLKYIEPIKSIILVLLVLLSITFTFSIWTYVPRYETNEQLPTVNISIAEKMKVAEIIKPYKIIFNQEEDLRGTSTQEETDSFLEEMKEWRVSDLVLADSNFSNEELIALMRKPNSVTLFFQGEVPLPVYGKVVNIEDMNVPEHSFDRVIIDWKPGDVGIDIHFTNRANNLQYSAKVLVDDPRHFQQTITAWGQNLVEYTDVDPDNLAKFIAVQTVPVETIRNTYFQEEINPPRFRDALFSDPNAVRRSQVNADTEEYGDDHALMTIDTDRKMLSYVVPAAESWESAIPSELLLNTIDYVNEHGGWTSDFRYTYMNPSQGSRYVKFQLYVNGLPVYSNAKGATEIVEVWGDNRIFRYTRPYYSLDLTPPFESEERFLQAGSEVAQNLREYGNIDFDMVEEIAPGYYLKQDTERRLFIIEPSWFYLVKGNWLHFSPEQLGGEKIGLE